MRRYFFQIYFDFSKPVPSTYGDILMVYKKIIKQHQRNIAESIYNNIKYAILFNTDIKYFKLCFSERHGREIC